MDVEDIMAIGLVEGLLDTGVAGGEYDRCQNDRNV